MVDTQIVKIRPKPFLSEPEMVDKIPASTDSGIVAKYLVYPRKAVLKTWLTIMRAKHVTYRGKWVNTKWAVKRLLYPETNL